MRVWIARDEFDGRVHMFEKRPVKDGMFFYDRNDQGTGFPLGIRPRLPIRLKRGQAARIELRIER